jgi:hypothetical protein
MLAALQHLRRQIDVVKSWGTRDDIPGSDAFVARQLAKHFSIPYMFGSCDTHGFVDKAERWCYLSELTTDNFGWFAEGAGFLSTFYASSIDVILLADESWGFGAFVTDERQAHVTLFPSKAPSALRRILREPFAEDADQMYKASIVNISQCCHNSNFVDHRDFMYLHGRLARFIFELGYYKELSTPLRRPFLSNIVLEVAPRLPPEHRIWKNLHISTLIRHFPATMVVPVSHVSSLPDWSFDMRSEDNFRRSFRSLLEFTQLEQGPLAEFVAWPAFERLGDEVFAAEVQPVSRNAPWWLPFRDRIGRITSRSLWVARALHFVRPTAMIRTSPLDILRCLALIALLRRQLSEFYRPGSPAL